MKTPIEIKHDHYRELFFDARASRGQIRGSLATPVAATAFTVFNLGTLSRSFDPAHASDPVGLAIGALAVAAVLLVLAAIYCMVRVEWHFVHLEPPDLAEITRIEDHIRAGQPTPSPQPDERAVVGEEIQNVLTGSYYVGYEAYIIGNARSARFRMWALRLVLTALACLSLAFLLLPFQASSASPGAAGV